MTLTEIRRSKDMSLGECARLSGLKASDLSRIERGSKQPDRLEVESIAIALAVKPEEVVKGIPTPEEAQAEFERVNDALAAMAVCQRDAKAKGFGKGSAGRGQIECPICKGILRYSVAATNGHMWGQCSTHGCVSWMQ